MSQLYVDNIKNRTGGAIGAPSGINVTGHTETNTLNVTGISTFNSKTRILDDVEFHVGTNGASGNYKFYRDDFNSRNILYEDISGAEARFISNIGGNSTAAFRFFKGSTQLARFSVNNIELFANNAVKFQTTASGIDVTGHTETDTLNVSGISTLGTVKISSGVVTATSGIVTYYGDGSQLTGIDASGISTTASSPTANSVVTLDLSSAQHHELNLSAGITTITCSGGSIGDSHSVLLIQPTSGIATVGFSTYFLFPSGATPAMSEGGGKIDLLSFVAKRVGAGGTQLLASAGLNYQ